MGTLCLTGSPIGGVERDVPRDRPLPAVAVREQAFLIVVELLWCLGRELKIRSQDDGVNGAGLLAEAAVDATHSRNVWATLRLLIRGGEAHDTASRTGTSQVEKMLAGSQPDKPTQANVALL